jgi:hypothetical protein
VTEKTEAHLTGEDTTRAARAQHQAQDATGGVKTTTRQFNRYLYENLISNVEEQIGFWNRRAVREPNPATAHALWLKAEGLGYALRLLYAFEPEFRELVDCARRSTTDS